MSTTKPEALRLAEGLESIFISEEIHATKAQKIAAELRRQHAELETLRAGYTAARLEIESLQRRVQEVGAVARREHERAAAPTTQPAPQQEAPADELEEVLRERDDAEDFINELLDEVLGADRPEWSSAYGRADALNDVQERMTALHKPAVDKAWDQFQSAMAAPSVLEDAARYRWLREQSFDTWKLIAWNTWNNDPAVWPDRDAAIDAARARLEGKP